MIANCFIILRHAVLFWVYCYMPFLSHCALRNVIVRRRCVFYRQQKAGQSKARWSSSTDVPSYSSIRALFLQPRWSRETSSLKKTNITHPHLCPWKDNSYPGRGVPLNSMWFISWSNRRPGRAISPRGFLLCHEDHTCRKMPAPFLCFDVVNVAHVPQRIIKIRHRPKHTLVVSNQINSSCLKERPLSGAQFDTWVIEVPAQVIIL